MSGIDFVVRPYDPMVDECFVMHSFMKSFVIPRLCTIPHAPLVCRLDTRTIVDYWHSWMSTVLSRGESVVSCDPEDSKFIFGWLAKYGQEIGYVYTRKLARKQGVARKLFKETGTKYSSPTRITTMDFIEAFVTNRKSNE